MAAGINRTLAEIGLTDEQVLKNRELAKAWDEEQRKRRKAVRDSIEIANLQRSQKLAKEGFSIEPYGDQIRMKDAEEVSNRKGNYASFPELANAYVRQHKDDKQALDKFKKMNPVEQRDFIANNIVKIFNDSNGTFFKAYNDAMNEAGVSKAAFMNNTFKNVQAERKYLEDNATKQDLAMQRYKDAFNVPYWSNKAINDFLQDGSLPYGANKGKVVFDKMGNEYAKMMFEFKQNRASETPREDFYNKVRKDYNTKPFEDRFGSVPLAERFKTKQSIASREPIEKVGGFVSRFIPIANTIEQSKEAGVDYPKHSIFTNSPLNVAESAFDAATLLSPTKIVTSAKAVGEGGKLAKYGPVLKSAVMGGIVGAKGALEGEAPVSDLSRYAKAAFSFGVGAGVGGGAYKISRVMPKYTTGGWLDKKRDALLAEIEGKKSLLGKAESYAKELDKVQSEINQYEVAKQAKNLRGELFGSKNMGGLQRYLDERSGIKPIDTESATPMERYNWASQRQLNEKVNTPLVYANVEPSSYEVVGANPLESPLQNLRRPGVDFSTPRAAFETATTYSPVRSPDTQLTEDRLTAAANYFMGNPKNREILENLGINNTKDFAKSDIGKQIYSEMVNYLDEPIAMLVTSGNKNPKVREATKQLWLKRNFPNGVTPDAENIFNEKLAIARSGYRPSELPRGKIEDTQVYKDTESLIKNYATEEEKPTLNSMLKSVKRPRQNIDEASSTIASIRNQITGDVNTSANVSGELRKQMSPNVVPSSVFEGAEKMRTAYKNMLDLFSKKKELKKNLSEIPPASKLEGEIADIDKSVEEIRLAKKGLSPWAVLATSTLSKPTGYALENAPLLRTASDEIYLPYSDENMVLRAANGLGNVGFYWDSPLINIRRAGSFKIPMQEKK